MPLLDIVYVWVISKEDARNISADVWIKRTVSDMQPFENDIEVLYNVTRVEQYSPPKTILMSYLLSLVLLLGLFGDPTEYMKG